ncbi:Signal recognition particle subunit SRP19 [Pleurostoma richardsiae]|uniref:Signal recognition particle subunit SRP19 n=1 Tax=Pleurostoma richardsiae TaxID=41990 RepID=A0AA38VL86_9PEZI|nr:Signal recognition particle subunit SRP19 [Pleurostoma richardsiae]
MSHPRIEEVEDSDVDMSDPSEGDIDDFVDSDILRSRVAGPSSSSSSSKPAAAAAHPPGARSHLINPSSIPSASSSGTGGAPNFQAASSPADYASFQCLYPVYFDATRTRAEGRRVPRSLAVRNPLAREIVAACTRLRLQTVFEPGKLHPKDWANPGRVKIALKQQQSKGGQQAAAVSSIKNKHHLYVLVAQHLRENPVTESSRALRERIQGAPAPDPDKPYPRPAVPRGWKMGELLPYYSPAMTGGGVSENLFKDMMKEMQQGGDMQSLLAGAGAGAGGSGSGSAAEEKKAKKDKKGKGKS